MQGPGKIPRSKQFELAHRIYYTIRHILHANNTSVDRTHNIGASILKLGDIDTQFPDISLCIEHTNEGVSDV